MTPDELAWAAGLFEGEGSISAQKGRPRLTLAMTDKDVVDRFRVVVGVGSVHLASRAGRKPHHKDQWLWNAGNMANVRLVLDLFQPWFGERRRARAAELLTAYDEGLAERMVERRCSNCGTTFRPTTPRNASKIRFCSPACRYQWFLVHHRVSSISPGQLTLRGPS